MINTRDKFDDITILSAIIVSQLAFKKINIKEKTLLKLSHSKPIMPIIHGSFVIWSWAVVVTYVIKGKNDYA